MCIYINIHTHTHRHTYIYKSWLIGKDSDAGRDWGQEEKGTTEDEMAGWHHWLDGRESEWTPGVGDGQGDLACCDSWGRKATELNWTDTYIYTHTHIVQYDIVFSELHFESSLETLYKRQSSCLSPRSQSVLNWKALWETVPKHQKSSLFFSINFSCVCVRSSAYFTHSLTGACL